MQTATENAATEIVIALASTSLAAFPDCLWPCDQNMIVSIPKVRPLSFVADISVAILAGILRAL
jgi:hypothetical protein